jgi:phosphoenolpyruvate carboxykinase (GTP)
LNDLASKEENFMNQDTMQLLKDRLDQRHFENLMQIDHPKLHQFVAEFTELCNPDQVYVCTDDPADIAFIRKSAIEKGEEIDLAIKGHTLHFDGFHDQARDKEHTKFLLPKGVNLGANINAIDKEAGLKEMYGILKDIMKGHTMYVRFFCLGPTQSQFSVLSCQLTDSAYVAHSLDILYRQGFEEFKRMGNQANFFRIIHSQGELEGKVSKHVDKRRVYIDTEEAIVYSANTQYGGNTLGLKKLSMRLAIHRASKEGWLCEHMLVMGVHGPNNRISYFTGAFPSLCGKTSTSMMTGETIVGDDIAYLRIIDGQARAVNVEKGMFGIIMGINSKDDPILWKTLHSPNEIIFSNVLMTENKSVYWIDKDGPVPEKGINYSGEWYSGKKDDKGNEITPSHKNARFTLKLKDLENIDPKADDSEGVEISGIIYGGRDSNTWVPVRESFDWTHGICLIAAALESETTAATLGKEGVPKFNPMSNLDFVSVPLGTYIQNNLDFGNRIDKPPKIFGVNYFLKDEKGQFLNDREDKSVWLKWMELRVHEEVDTIVTPVGKIPKYMDLKHLFQNVLNKGYSEDDYRQQYSIRVDAFLKKINRILDMYRQNIPDTPSLFYTAVNSEIERLNHVKDQLGNVIAPEAFL